MQPSIDPLIDAINVALLAGNWPAVVEQAGVLSAHALAFGEVQLAELAHDIQVIALDAVRYPSGDDGRLEVVGMVG
jgi:hypothetical protein